MEGAEPTEAEPMEAKTRGGTIVLTISIQIYLPSAKTSAKGKQKGPSLSQSRACFLFLLCLPLALRPSLQTTEMLGCPLSDAAQIVLVI